MIEERIYLPSISETEVIRLVEKIARETGLVQSLKGTLRKYAGCTHWHFKRDREPGTLEVTYLPADAGVVLSVHSNRRGTWTAEALEQIVCALRAVPDLATGPE